MKIGKFKIYDVSNIFATYHYSNSVVIVLKNGKEISVHVSLSDERYNEICEQIENLKKDNDVKTF